MELKARLKNGEKVCGMMLSEFYVPNIARLIASVGFDFVIVDCEHGYFDYTQVANLVAVAEGAQLPVIVRIARPDRCAITKYLDMGVRGVLLANAAGVDEARELANLCLYSPQGDRGISTFRAHTGYHNGDTGRVMREANERMLVICQIESPAAVAQCEQMLSLPGVDGALIGPNDLSQHMHLFAQFDHPQLHGAIESVAQAAKRAGKWSGIITADKGLLQFSRQAGMTCFSSGSELSMLSRGAKEEMEKLKAL